jgi:hypothetical protein
MASGPVCRTTKAEHMAAPTNAANVKKLLPTRSRPHMAHRGLPGPSFERSLLEQQPTNGSPRAEKLRSD